MSLPTAKTPPRDSMCDLTVLIYGASKIGKSTLCSNADQALFLACEAGLNSLNVYQQPILTWQDMLTACAEIGKGDHGFKTIVIDTVDNAYKMCAEHMCRKVNIQHESDLGFGKGFALVNNEFQRVLTKLSLMPYGLYLISHAQDKEMDTPTGKRLKTIPTLPGKAREIVLGMVDIILYCDLETVSGPDGKKSERRVLRTKPSALYEAGDRTKRLPDTIDLDFQAFVDAYRSGGSTQAGSAAPAPAPAPTSSPEEPAGGKPAASAPEPPDEWVDAMAQLAKCTVSMEEKSRKALVAEWEKAGPAALADLREETRKLWEMLNSSKPPKPPISPETEAFVDGVDPLPDSPDGAITREQYDALGLLLGAYGINRDAYRAYSAKAGHLLPGANGPTLARLKAEEFKKLREKLMDNKVAARGETWSARTIRIINSTPIAAFTPAQA